MKQNIEQIIHSIKDAETIKVSPQHIAIAILYTLSQDKTFAYKSVINKNPKQPVKYNFYDTPEFDAAMKHIQPVIIDILDKASVYAIDILKQANLHKASEIREREREGERGGEKEGIDLQQIKSDLLNIIRDSAKAGETKDFLDALNALQKHFPLERPDVTAKYINVKAKNNGICPNCRMEVYTDRKNAESI
jgi:hypothetical protein